MTGRDEPAITAAGLTKRYGGTAALRGVSLQVSAGTATALLGPDGAGKTTMVRILSALLRPDAGAARVGGAEPDGRAAGSSPPDDPPNSRRGPDRHSST